MSTSDHDELGKVVPGQTMQLDALPEELVEGLTGEDGGYQLADGPGVSMPPPLPPRGSEAPPASAPPPAAPPADGGSNKTLILAVVVAVLMAVAGVVVGTMVLGEDEAEPTDPGPMIEFGDIEVQSH